MLEEVHPVGNGHSADTRTGRALCSCAARSERQTGRETGEADRYTEGEGRHITLMTDHSHHERPHDDIRHLRQLVVQQGGGGVVCYLATAWPIRDLHHCVQMSIKLRTGESYLLEHLVLRLGPDVQLRRT